MKLIVETTGQFMIMNGFVQEEVPHNRPAVITSDSYWQNQIAIGQLRVLASEMPDAATDAEWADWLKASDGDVVLAVESYKAKFVPPEPDLKRKK